MLAGAGIQVRRRTGQQSGGGGESRMDIVRGRERRGDRRGKDTIKRSLKLVEEIQATP